MKRLLPIFCLFLSLIAVSDAAQAQRLFVLVAADTTDEAVRDGTLQNMQWIRTAFRYGVPKDQLVVRFLHGEKLSRDSLLDSLKNCPLGENDSLVFWWLGRGKFENDQRILIFPDGSKLPSTEVRECLASRMTRLAVLVIDAYERTIPAADLPPKTMDMARADTLLPVFESLFFKPQGVVTIDSAESGQRPLLLTTTGGLLTSSILLPPGALGDINNEAGFITLHTPTGDRELVMERGILYCDLNDSIEWDTVLSQIRSATSANYRRAMGRKHVGEGQTPTFAGTTLKYADHFVEWQPVAGEFRSRPRESRTVVENGSEVRYQGDKKMSLSDLADRLGQPDESMPQGSPIDSSANTAADPELGYYKPIPGDHLVQVNNLPIRTQQDFIHAMRILESNSGDIRFILVDNQSGNRIHYITRMNPRTDRDFGIKPWFWKNSFVVLHEVRPGSPAARAKAVRVVEPNLPEQIGLGVRGKLVRIDNPLFEAGGGAGGRQIVGVKIGEVTDPKRSDLKPGDVVFMIDGYDFNSAEGYRYALKYSRMLAGLWYVDGSSGKVKHGIVSLPHKQPTDFVEPPPGTGTISITPSGMETGPIW